MSRRRTPGTGSVRLRPDTGRYHAALVTGYDQRGNPQRLRKDFDTVREADLWLAEQRLSQSRGELVLPRNETLEQRVHGWLATKERDVRASTLRDYRTTLERLVLPHLGSVKIAELKPLHVERLLATLHAAGQSAYGQAKAHKYLGMVLADAVRLELVHRNVARAVRPPRPPTVRHARWSPDDALKVAAYCQGLDHPVARYVLVGLSTGLRREELLGLRWADVNTATQELRVRHTVTYQGGAATHSSTPKSEAGHRTVHFDQVAATALVEQLAYVELARVSATRWTEHDLAFPSSVGTPMSESYLRENFRRIVEEAGAPLIRLYDLRSTHGSILAAAGVNPKLISERLGHADVAFTLRVYVRTDEAERRAAGQVFGAAVQWQPVAGDPAKPATRPPGEAGDKPALTVKRRLPR